MPYGPYSPTGKAEFIPREDVIASIFSMVISAWPKVCRHSGITETSEEREITYQLYLEMKKEKSRNKLGILIIEEGSERHGGKLRKRPGFIDFKFFDKLEECSFFGLECKKVKGAGTSLAGAYVTKGVMRITSGKYCADHDYGGMAAFVMDGKITGAVENLKNAMDKRQEETSQQTAWQKTDDFGNISNLFITTHKQEPHGTSIILLHLLLALN